MKVVRWVGAFGKNGSLLQSLKWELEQDERKELAAEPLVSGRSSIRHARVGLLVKRSAVIKIFTGDCWSKDEFGKLVKTRNPKKSCSRHKETWIRPEFIAIVVKDYGQLKGCARKTVQWFSEMHDLPILHLKKGGLHPK